MKINSTNSPKNILRKWQERAQDSERVFLSATPGLIRPQGDIHLHDHVIDYDWQEDDVHLRAGRPDRDQDGAAGRRLHRLRPLLGEGEVVLFPWGGTGSIWHFYVLATYLFLRFLSCPDARKLQEYLGRSISWDPRWRQVSVYSVASLKWVLPILMEGGFALFFCPKIFFDCNNIWKKTTNYDHGQIISF